MRKNQTSPVKGSLRSSFSAFRTLAITAILLLGSVVSAWATHFRYGNVQWTNTSGNTVVFKIQQAWRWSYFGNPAIGSQVEIAAADGAVPFNFGDSTSQDIVLTITSVNVADDWFFGEVTFTHTYAQAGNYTSFFLGCCRISTLQNNADSSFRVQSKVNVGSGAKSTVSTIVPIVDVPANNAAATFPIPSTDPDGHALTYRLANASEASESGESYTQPSGISVNSSTGMVTLNTVGKTVGDLYTTQIIINNGVTEVAVDFLIRIIEAAPVNTPPYFVYPPTPANGSTISVDAGQPISFNVQAKDDDQGSSVTLTVVGMPIGAATSPELPTTGQPVSTQFNWTPANTDAGTYLLIFTATDNNNNSVSSNVILEVKAVCDPNFSGTISVGPSPTVKGQAPNTIFLGYGPQRVTLTGTPSGGTAGYTYDWGGNSTGASIVVKPKVTTTYTVVIKDTNGCTTSSSVTINVVDVRCGKNGDKVVLCHSGCQYTMCVLRCKVARHLKHGDKLGACITVVNHIASSAQYTEVETSDVKEMAVAKKLKVYPNPASDHIVVQLQDKDAKNAYIRITDAMGKAMLNIKCTNPDRQIVDVSKLGKGVYTIQIISASGKVIGKSKLVIMN